MVDTDSLIPYVNNARIHSAEQVAQIAASIKEFGFNNPVLMDGDKGVIAGHGRLLAAIKLDIKKVPAVELSHLSEIQKKAYILADNKLADNAGWDNAILDVELEALSASELEVALTGFIYDEPLLKGELTDVDEVPEVPEEPVTKPGDLYLLDGHRVLCGDSTDKEQVARLMDGKNADMVFTDPPFDFEDNSWFYNIENNFNGHFFIYGSEKVIIPFLTNDNFCRLFAVDFRNGILISNKMPFTRVDFVAEFKNVKTKFINTKDGFSTLIEMSKIKSHQKQNIGHPHQKKVELIELFLSHYTSKNEIVADVFLGSGTTLIACEKNNRRCFGIEKNPAYCDIIIKRFENITSKKAVLENNN